MTATPSALPNSRGGGPQPGRDPRLGRRQRAGDDAGQRRECQRHADSGHQIGTARLIAATIPTTSTTQPHITASRPRGETGRGFAAGSRIRTFNGMATTLWTQMRSVPRNFHNDFLRMMQLWPSSST
jgi:hypothetical protein